jgi:serine/threonine protein kinase
VSEDCKDIITKLLVKDPKKRLGSETDSLEILAHPWFQGLDLNSLLAKQLRPPLVPDIAEGKWEKNFDEEFIAEKIRMSEFNPVKVDVERLKMF